MNSSLSRKLAIRNPGRRLVALCCRWLHIYLSLISLAVIVFFSITCLTLNHPDWFFSESTSYQSRTLNSSLLINNASPPASWDQLDFSHQVNKLEFVELLRARHYRCGTVTGFLTYEDEAELTFQGPGNTAIAKITRTSGDYTVAITTNDLVSIFKDLHKGRNSGKAWSVVIDISAIVSAIVAVSGFALIFFLRVRRTRGLLTAFVGTLLLVIMYRLAVS